MTHAWIDASAGVAGDMLLGALIDAGASLDAVRQAVAAVIGDAVTIEASTVTRAGLRATYAQVALQQDDPPHRTWTTIQQMLTAAPLPAPVRDNALKVFAALAEAEGRVHGVPASDIHFHEVGALDSIADVVGVCAALNDLGVGSLSAGPVAVGSGRVRAAHGSIPVPVPAVVELAQGRRIQAGGDGELTTPTGMALIAALAPTDEDLPGIAIQKSGTGAGTKDFADRPNVTRVLLGKSPSHSRSQAVQLEANIDDLDPRLWPGVLRHLMQTGADDAWLVPILMKKGRPAHQLTVLAHPTRADQLEKQILQHTSTLGVRRTTYTKRALARGWIDVPVDGSPLAVKIGHDQGLVLQVMPEFDAVAALAEELGWSERRVLAAAFAAAETFGWSIGSPPPEDFSALRNHQ
ncbi:nickel pincer cofactor biosynthesis protein LarC [Kineosporia babensis]|uniref:Pyridinium-3,5-bisthiocarboxylic acid mononucleotide nickel insertion protein n=1 Tax=Kineosporia babensis TaxID=499548 RepID=A0A9X1NID3_9ACTN|nr:nickel pincer cofactor biosynthesis protein LarC [Kineosporia babensis]MCD5314326.1 nickel pincer cofactor biosynthesis protein LarC [Kineosporia babensis]